MSSQWDNDEEVQRFRDYLRIPTVHPDIDYTDCVNFFKKQAALSNLPVTVYELVHKKPVVVITWKGTQPELSSILLNSHMDVVPVYEEHWKYPPFDAHITPDGWIYARGTQDIKGIGMMHLESVRRLKSAGVSLKRTVHVCFVPDEEIGGIDGMKTFSESEEFRKLNVGIELDESMPSDNGHTFNAFNAEKTGRQIKISCKGKPGHGALLEPSTAGDKIAFVISKFMELRQNELKKHIDGAHLGDVTSINLTKLEGGVQVNVLPEELSVSFDIRISPKVDHKAFEKMLQDWCEEAGEDVTMEYYVKNPEEKITSIGEDAPFWKALHKAIRDMNLDIKCATCPGTTDARYIRRQGVPAIGFSPLLNTPLLLHAHNERVHAAEFKKGISVMEKVLLAIANV